MCRAKKYPLVQAQQLVQFLQKQSWDYLIISGDLTSLALREEFILAKQILSPLLDSPQKVLIIPGNHDRYVQDACQPDLFTEYFGDFFTTEEIKTIQITPKWHLIGWDSTHPNSWDIASGTVSYKTLQATENYLQSFNNHEQAIIVNHYPLWFPENYTIHKKHELYNLQPIRYWIEQQNKVRMYLHGHVHHNWRKQIAREGKPLDYLNSASSTMLPHRHTKSLFHMIHLNDDEVEIEPIYYL